MILVASFVIFFNVTATAEIYTLSLPDALPIYEAKVLPAGQLRRHAVGQARDAILVAEEALDDQGKAEGEQEAVRSEEHTSELQSRQYLVCRLLLEKKNTPNSRIQHFTLRKQQS